MSSFLRKDYGEEELGAILEASSGLPDWRGSEPISESAAADAVGAAGRWVAGLNWSGLAKPTVAGAKRLILMIMTGIGLLGLVVVSLARGRLVQAAVGALGLGVTLVLTMATGILTLVEMALALAKRPAVSSKMDVAAELRSSAAPRLDELIGAVEDPAARAKLIEARALIEAAK